jgi:hypothetical protein
MPGRGFWSLAAGYLLLDIKFLILDARYWMLDKPDEHQSDFTIEFRASNIEYQEDS